MRYLMVLVIFPVLFGCATPYQKSGAMGGFSEIQLQENVFQVDFRGNGYTSPNRARDFTLLRSAEIALENGFSYFLIVDSSQYTEKSSYTTPATSRTTGNIYGSSYGNISGSSYGNSYSGHLNTNSYYNFNSTTTTTPAKTYTISRPTSSNKIVCFKEKPEREVDVFNASLIYNSLSKKYGLNQPEKAIEVSR